MDPPDVLGMDSGTARPTKLPNRAKSKFIQKFKHINGIFFTVFVHVAHNGDHAAKCLKLSLSEQPPPRPPQPAVLLKSEFFSYIPALPVVYSHL